MAEISEQMTDEELVEKYLKGDQESLEILIARHFKAVYGFVFRYFNNEADAQDVTQEAFIKAWKKIKRFDRKKNFKVWIFAIAKNTAIDRLRQKTDLPLSKFDDEEGDNFITDTLADSSPLPDELFMRQDLAEQVSAWLERLSVPYREVLYLHHFEQLNFREISESLAEPLNTVKSRYRRGLIQLRKLIDNDNN